MAGRRSRTRAALLGAVALGAAVAVAVGALVGGSGDDQAAGPGLPVPAAIAQDGGRLNEIYDRAAPSVVFIQARIAGPRQSPFGSPQPRGGIATGSGFVIDREGTIVTNAHIVENAADVGIRVDRDTLVDADVVGSDLSTDLAVLEVDPGAIDVEPLPLGDSDRVEVGDPVVALGNPLGFEDTITAGIVSAKQRQITAPNGYGIENVIQTDAAVNPGNSGGPLIDLDGRVIGVNSQIATASRGATGFIGIAFAVPVNTVKRIVPDLRDDGNVLRPYLGVTTTTLTPELARQLDLEPDRGALVVAVAEGSPAARAGLRGGSANPGVLTGEGDVIVQVEDTEVTSSDDLAEAIRARRVGESVRIVVFRDGRRLAVDVEVTDRQS